MTNKEVDLTSGIHTSEEFIILSVSWTFPKDDVFTQGGFLWDFVDLSVCPTYFTFAVFFCPCLQQMS